MEKARSNELISNLTLDNSGYIVHAKYTRNSDGKEMDDLIIPHFTGYDLESCKNLINDLEKLKQEQNRDREIDREMNPNKSYSQKFYRYASERNTMNRLLDSHQKVNRSISKDAKMDKILDHAEFLVTNFTVMYEFRKAKDEAYEQCDPSFQRTTPSKEDMNQLTQDDLIDLLNQNEHLKSQLLEKNKQLESQL